MRVRLLPVLSPAIGFSLAIAGCQSSLPVMPPPDTLAIQATVSNPTIPSVTRSKLMPLEQTLVAFGMNLLRRAMGNLQDNSPTGFSWQQPNKLNTTGPTPLIPGVGSAGSRVGSGGFGSAVTGGLGLDPGLPGWGTGTWGASGQPGLGQSAPGQFNLSRGAGQIGGFGMDNGFFSIPQDEISKQIRAQMDAIDQSRTGVPGQGTTGLDPKKYPFLHPVKGPLIPPGK